MTIEQMTELSELTSQAAANDDIETLKKIKSIIDNSEPDIFQSKMGDEWFYSSLTSAQINALE
jgi:hypothetical protein